jgi:hypothetical protein
MTGLNRELLAYKEDAEFPMIRHPLVYAVPFFDTPSEVDRLNKYLASKKEVCEKALGKHEYDRFVFLHERAYRIDAFQEVQENLSDQQYWPLLQEIWTDCENIFQNHIQWWEMLSSPRKRKAMFTPCADRGVLKKLPDELKIYRGTTAIERHGHYLGFSWTLDKDKARWFATRLNKPLDGTPMVASAIVAKKYICGYIDARGEQEIVVEPKELEGLEWEDTK